MTYFFNTLWSLPSYLLVKGRFLAKDWNTISISNLSCFTIRGSKQWEAYRYFFRTLAIDLIKSVILLNTTVRVLHLTLIFRHQRRENVGFNVLQQNIQFFCSVIIAEGGNFQLISVLLEWRYKKLSLYARVIDASRTVCLSGFHSLGIRKSQNVWIVDTMCRAQFT